MSIVTMVNLGMSREREALRPRLEAANADRQTPANAKTGVEAALSKLTAFVPTEVVGFYIAGLGALAPQTSTGKWCMFAFCLFLIPLFMWVSALLQKKKDPTTELSWRRWFILLAFAVVAFVAWAAALPDTPFRDLSSQATVIAGFAVIVLSVFMNLVAELLDVVPQSS